MRGGAIVVHGNLGSRAGQVMKDGQILCGGNANFMAGYMMMGGRIVICGDCRAQRRPEYDRRRASTSAADARAWATMPHSRRSERRGRGRHPHDCSTQYGIRAPQAFQKIASAQQQHHYATYERGEGPRVPAEGQRAYKTLVHFPTVRCGATRVVEDITTKAEIGRYRVRGYGAFRELPTLRRYRLPLRSGGARTRLERCARASAIWRPSSAGNSAANRLSLSMPIMIAPMSYGALSKHCKIALARASALAGTATNTGEGGMMPEERAAASQMIYQCLSGRFGFNPHDMQKADAIEIYISQGAKPGLGGQLMGKKITEEIAAIRGIPRGMDLRSPSRHPDVMGADDLVIKIEEFREATDWRVPISLKIGAGRLKDDIKIALKDNVDFIEVDGMQGGTGASSDVVTENVGIPSLAAIVQAINGLREIDEAGKLQIVLMGGIRNGVDAAKAIALGADAVAIGTDGAYRRRLHRLHALPPRQLHSRHRHPDHGAGRTAGYRCRGGRVANFLDGMATELAAITLACGKSDVHQLQSSDLVALTPAGRGDYRAALSGDGRTTGKRKGGVGPGESVMVQFVRFVRSD